MEFLKIWAKRIILPASVVALTLGAFNNCQKFGPGDGIAVGVDHEGEVCIQEIGTMFHPETKTCVSTINGCEVKSLREEGYIEVDDIFCSHTENPSSKYEWTRIKVPRKNEVCTENYAILVNREFKLCFEGRDGCAIGYAESVGFEIDTNNDCPSDDL